MNAHQWMDLSQHDYGVSLLNDGKYGCDVLRKTLRLTLLKGSIHPDPEADMEVHHFTYAIYPHTGGWREAETVRVANELNLPLLAQRCEAEAAGKLDGAQPIKLDGLTGVDLVAVKRADDGQGMIVRLVERYGSRARGAVVLDRPVQGAGLNSIMEDPEGPIEVQGNAVPVELKPYEIKTLRILC